MALEASAESGLLTADEFRYVLGSVVISILAKPHGVARLLRQAPTLVSLARMMQDGPVGVDQLARRDVGHDTIALATARVQLDPNAKNHIRYLAGAALLEASSSVGGALRLPAALYAILRRAKGYRVRIPPPARAPIAREAREARQSQTDAELPPHDVSFQWDVETEPGLAEEQRADGPPAAEAADFVWEVETEPGLAEEQRVDREPEAEPDLVWEVETEPGLAEARSTPPVPEVEEPEVQPAPKRKAEPVPVFDWAIETEPGLVEERTSTADHRALITDDLLRFGQLNTGIKIEPLVGKIVRLLATEQLASLRQMFERGNERRAFRIIRQTMAERSFSSNGLAYLDRLQNVLDAAAEGIVLPPRAAAPAYEPDGATVLYTLHMRDPYELNGYVSRSHLILRAMRAGGLTPIAVTRLGFPHDLARHGKVDIAAREELDGFPYIALRDEGGGMLRRPIGDYVAAYADRLVEIARELRPAAIQAASNYVNGLAAITASRRLGIPCVYEVRGIWEITQVSANPELRHSVKFHLQRRLEDQAVESADRVATISESLRQFVIDNGAVAENVCVIPNGVDALAYVPRPPDLGLRRSLGIPDDVAVIGYVGSVVHYEGLDILLKALARLRERGCESFRFLLVGEGVQLAHLKEMASDWGVAGKCRFVGRVAREEVTRYYSLIDIAPLPRRSLPVTELVPPLKPYEAMAMAKTVVVSSVRALAGTVVEGETGFVVKENDAGALADVLQKLIEDRELCRRIGANAREWVARERTVESLGREVASLYGSLGLPISPPA